MENKNLTNEVIRISGSNPKKCMKCGKCTATCPAFEQMDIHTHQFVDMIVNGRIEELLNANGIYNCLSCFACMERCPRSVEPARLIEAVRVAVIRQKENNHLKPDAIPAMLDAELPQQAITSALRKYRK